MTADTRTVAATLAIRMAAAQAGNRKAYESVLVDSAALIRTNALACGVPITAIGSIVEAALMTVHNVRHTYDPSHCYLRWLDAIARLYVGRYLCSTHHHEAGD